MDLNNTPDKWRTKATQMVVVLCLIISMIAKGQDSNKQLDGIWVNNNQNRKVEFVKEGNVYTGKVVWVAEGENKVKVGDVLFKNVTSDGKRYKGTAVTPAQGDVPCTMSFEKSTDVVKITASKGPMSRSVYWSRVK